MVTIAHSVATFDQKRQEYESLGFECVEMHLGYETELFDSGLIPVNKDQVVIARFVQRSDV